MSKSNHVFKDAYNRGLRLLGERKGLPSEPDLGTALGISRTTVRTILAHMAESGLIEWNKRRKVMLREPVPSDFFPADETDSLTQIIERSFMQRVFTSGGEPGLQINELELAREIGVGTTSVREFLIRFARFGLIEKRPNSHWVLKGFTRDFALDLTEIREMFEQRSALAFASLSPDNAAWAELSALETEHRALGASIATRYREFSELDERFHRLIHSASRNRFIVDFYDVIAMVFHYHYQWNKAEELQRNGAAVAEHLAYIAALQSRDPARVREACRMHLASARTTLLQSIPDGPVIAERRAMAKGQAD